MIPSLYIRNFRLFRELKINCLGRVNLFVGKNSTGKSSILEAVQVFSARGYPGVLEKILLTRDEIWDERFQEDPSQLYGNLDDLIVMSPFRHFFHRHNEIEIFEEGLSIGSSEEDSEKIRMIYRAFKTDLSGNLVKPLTPLTKLEIDEGGVIENGVFFAIQDGEALFPLINRYSYVRSRFPHFRRDLADRSVKKGFANLQTVPSFGIVDEDVSQLWDQINLTDLEQEAVDAVRLIQPHVRGIAFIGAEGRQGTRRALVRLEGTGDRIPMKSLGDGVIRVFQIILALVNAKDGVLLLDEAENGLHWGIHEKLWRIIFRLAEKLNVQVFATTHSWDCVQGFHQAWAEREDLGAFFRLSRSEKDAINCTSYPRQTLGNSLETGVEMR